MEVRRHTYALSQAMLYISVIVIVSVRPVSLSVIIIINDVKRKLNHKRMITRVGLLIVSVTMSQKRILDNHLILILLVGKNLLARGGLNGQCLL